MTLRVMSGAKIDIFGKSYYAFNNSPCTNHNIPILNIITGFPGATGGTAASKGFTAIDLNSLPLVTDPVNDFLGNPARGSGTVPKAYINWILFDENFQKVDGKFSRVNTIPGLINHHDDPELQNIPVTKMGIFMFT